MALWGVLLFLSLRVGLGELVDINAEEFQVEPLVFSLRISAQVRAPPCACTTGQPATVAHVLPARNWHDLLAEVLPNLLHTLACQALNGGAFGEGKVIQLAGVWRTP